MLLSCLPLNKFKTVYFVVDIVVKTISSIIRNEQKFMKAKILPATKSLFFVSGRLKNER